ncbi:unnamed protein product [Lactuca saligna]|uniref:Condensin complex subunit 1 C-terminal domain-containing protein n=1 Tax=Lactuca saligna TaxID=75948 RepID=A0AA36ELC0_LACSI|nr:unnamed protein product [Lactuca saligna]
MYRESGKRSGEITKSIFDPYQMHVRFSHEIVQLGGASRVFLICFGVHYWYLGHCISYAVVGFALLGAAVTCHLSVTNPLAARRDALQITVIRHSSSSSTEGCGSIVKRSSNAETSHLGNNWNHAEGINSKKSLNSGRPSVVLYSSYFRSIVQEAERNFDQNSDESTSNQQTLDLNLALTFQERWVQVFILDVLSKYKAADAREVENIVERVTPRLQHANCVVVLSPVKKEIQYVSLRNINLIVQRRPTILAHEIKPPFIGGHRQKIQEKIVKDKIKLPVFLSSEAHSLLKGDPCDQNFPGAPTFLPVVQFAGQHPGGLGVPAVGMAFPGYVTQPNGMGNSEMTWLPILAGATGAFGCFTLYHNGWCLSCYAIWPDLYIASYKVDHTCLAKRYSVCFQICLLPEFFFFLSWQPSIIVLDRHLLAKDIVYVFFCCYCGSGNILAY